MSPTNLRTIKSVRSFAAEKEVFIRDIDRMVTPLQNCHLCGGEMAVEFIMSQPALMIEAPYVVSIAVFVCTDESCATPRAYRWIESPAGPISVPNMDKAEEIFARIMDEWDMKARQVEEHMDFMSKHDDADKR